jgi:hypothetical protein
VGDGAAPHRAALAVEEGAVDVRLSSEEAVEAPILSPVGLEVEKATRREACELAEGAAHVVRGLQTAGETHGGEKGRLWA